MTILKPAIALLALSLPAAAETVSVDGHDVWYRVEGTISADTPPLLLLHGGMMSADLTWDALVPELGKDRAVILVDQQGHGRTPDREGAITLDSMRGDTLAVLDALKVQKAHVVGFSLGGMLGLDLAVHAPERVATLTAISASQNADGMLPEIVAMNRNPGTMPPPEVAALLPTPEDFKAMAAGFADNPSGPEVMGTTMVKLGTLIGSGWGWSNADLAGITVPVQLLIGDRDFVTPEHALHLSRTIPDAWLAVLPDSTHMTMLRHPALPGLIAHRMTAE